VGSPAFGISIALSYDGNTAMIGGNRPDAFALFQNHPNPFNPSTVISYTLPQSIRVRLSVYNILGQEVATLVDGIQDAGYKSVKFNSSSLPSDIDSYRLFAGTYSDVRKLMIVK